MMNNAKQVNVQQSMNLEQIVNQTRRQLNELSDTIAILSNLVDDYQTVEQNGRNGTTIVDQFNKVRARMIETLAQTGNDL